MLFTSLEIMQTALFCNVFSQVSLPESLVFCPKNHIISVAKGAAAPLIPPPPVHTPIYFAFNLSLQHVMLVKISKV